MILDIAQIVLGIFFFMFLPGWLIVQAFFRKNKPLERILFAIVISVMIGLVVGVFFGYDRAQASLTGGFTEKNIWVGEIVATLIAAIVLFISKRVKKRVKPPKNKAIKNKQKSI